MRVKALLLLLACVFAATAFGAEKKAALLAISKGAMPDHTTDDPKLAIEEKPELGGPALKVTFGKGSAFGRKQANYSDWTSFRAIAFEAFNPATEILPLALCLRHRGTRTGAMAYPTRADVIFMLQPGKNSLEFGLADLANVNGSRPDLEYVTQWYITCAKDGATAYFGDFWLLGEGGPAPAWAPATPPGPAVAAAGTLVPAGPSQPIRITGKIGDTPVDLTITGLQVIIGQGGGSAPAPQPAAPPNAATPAAPAPTAGAKAALLAVSKGSMPGDTNADPKISLDEVKELGGVALKVTFGKDASFGDSHPKIADWHGFANLTFTAINPSQNPVPITVTIKHKGTRSFATRVDRDLVLAPGKNDVAVPLAGLASNDGTAADLSQVKHWYVASNSEATILFGDFCLEGPK